MSDESEKKVEGVSAKSEQEQIKQLKRHLESWREVLLPINSVLVWDKPFYPGIIGGIVTFIFVWLWYFEPSVLTTLSIIGIVICLLDYGVPVISTSVFDSSKWTGTQEQKFEDICKELVYTRQHMLELWESMNNLKETKPRVYFVGVLASLVLTAWIGNLIDNLLLTYMIVMVATLLPGIKHHGILQQYFTQAIVAIKEMIGQKKKKN